MQTIVERTKTATEEQMVTIPHFLVFVVVAVVVVVGGGVIVVVVVTGRGPVVCDWKLAAPFALVWYNENPDLGS